MKTLALFAALLVSVPAFAEDGAAEDYARALDKENTDRDVNGAMEIYRSILKKHKDEDEVSAKAQYRIGECWEKLGVQADARQAYEDLIRDFPGQAALVDKAKERLAAMAGEPVPATAEERTKKKLTTTRIDLDFTDTSLTDILDFIGQFAGISCLLDPKAKDLNAKQISFSIKDLPLNKVLDLLAETCHASWINWNGTLIWSTADRITALKQWPSLAADAGAEEDDQKVERSLRSIKVSLNFTETPIETTFSFIREVSQLNFVLDQSCPDSKISLRIEDAVLIDVLTLVGFMNDLDIHIKNGAVLVKGK